MTPSSDRRQDCFRVADHPEVAHRHFNVTALSRAVPHDVRPKRRIRQAPKCSPPEKESRAVVSRLPDWRVDLQEMRFAESLKPRVQRLTRRERVVVRSVNEEYRRPMCAIEVDRTS
jgi:hypothetical protein